MMKKFKFIDLFCGLGGFRISLEKIGGTCVFSSDIDKYVQKTYKDNFGELPNGDITKINEKDIPNHDVLCGGFPCQPFSIAGKRLGFEDTRGTLFFDVYRIIKEKKPKIIFLENVKGLLNHDNGNTLKVIVNSLEEIGYHIKYKILKATSFGLPQNRERFILVGFNISKVKGNYKEFEIPEEDNTVTSKIEDFINTKNKTNNITPRCKKNMESHFSNEIKNMISNKEIVLAHNVRPSKCSFALKKIAPCLTAKMGTGGNNVPIIANFSRKLSTRECLNLMGFPENYIIKDNYSQSYKQIGNSVAIPMIYGVAKNFKDFI